MFSRSLFEAGDGTAVAVNVSPPPAPSAPCVTRCALVIAGRRPRCRPRLRPNPRNEFVAGTGDGDDELRLGRVRVKFPALSGDNEGNWARVVGPAAGKDRGLMMMPQVGDEVVVAFEHDNVMYPYVLGSLWNGKDTPGDLVQHDGSFVLQSDKFMNLKSKDSISIKSEKDYSLEVQGAFNEKVEKDITIETKTGAISEKAAKEITIEGGTSVKIKGGSDVTVEASGSLTIKANSSLTIQSSGVVKVSGSQIMLG